MKLDIPCSIPVEADICIIIIHILYKYKYLLSKLGCLNDIYVGMYVYIPTWGQLL